MISKKTLKILIFGPDGLLGRELINILESKKKFLLRGVSHRRADIADIKAVKRELSKFKPDVIINAAALIGVEYCDSHPTEALNANALGPGIIMRAIKEKKLHRSALIHVSTSEVFGNEKNKFTESDIPNPLNIYGFSKLGGEKLIEAEARGTKIKYFIARTSWLYGSYRDTFVDMVVKALKDKKKFPVVKDQFGVPTCAHDLVKGIYFLIQKRNSLDSGIYHLVNEGAYGVSKYEIALQIAKSLKLNPKYLKGVSKKYIFDINRPKNATLVNSKIPKFISWRESLHDYLLVKYGREK